MRLTAKERIILHLLEYRKYSEEVEVPRDVTQEGIAKAVWVDLPHLAQYMRPLIREGLVRERTAHVKESRRRRKVYNLTEGGQTTAVRLREKMRSEVVTLRDADGMREATVSEVLKMMGDRATLLEIAHQVDELGAIDARLVAAPPAGTFVEILSDAPQVERFVGRSRELDAIVREDGGARILVVRGVAGIGKSALGAKACGVLRGKRNLFWHRIRPWDSRESILFQVGGFLAALGKPGLQVVLSQGQAARAPQVFREDVRGTRSYLVFDNAEDVTPEALAFFRLLVEAVAEAPDVRALILSRRSLPFYNRRDVVLKRLVAEVDLKGLESHDVAAYLSKYGRPGTPLEVAQRVRGHPLALELLGSQDSPSGSLGNVRRYLEEEIYGSLSEAERGMMKVASLYQVPVPREALFARPEWPHDILLSLVEKSLLRAVGETRVEVHETIREFFSGVFTPAERREVTHFVVDQLHHLASGAGRESDFGRAAGYLHNAIQLSASAPERLSLLEALGEVKVRAGDLLATSVAYRTAMKGTRDPVCLARLHRKLGAAFRDWGEAKQANEEVEAGLAVLGDASGPERGWLHVVRSRILELGAELREAQEEAEAALRIFQNAGDLRGQAEALSQMGRLAWYTGAMEDGRPIADRYLREALDLSRTVGDPALTANILVNMMSVASWQFGDAKRAQEIFSAVEALPGALDHPTIRLRFLSSRAWFRSAILGDHASARSDIVEFESLAKLLRNDDEVAYGKYLRSAEAQLAGDLSEAGRCLEGALESFRRLGNTRFAQSTLFLLALHRLMERDVAGFRSLLTELDQASRVGSAEWLVNAKMARALDDGIQGDWPKAEHIFRELLHELERRPVASQLSRLERPRVYACYGVVLKVMGRTNDGEEFIRKGSEIYRSSSFLGLAELSDARMHRLSDALLKLGTIG
jgi:tetratricopeptide (TPR) repeat protein/DNA-binding PadR family transcriptional regulator